MKYLVTGASGFIGRHLADFLVAKGHEVTGLDIRPPEFSPSWRFTQGSVLDPSLLAILASGCDGIFHLAAIASVPATIHDPSGTHAVNVTGTLNVLEAARRAGGIPVAYASSAAVYGDVPALPLAESAAGVPLSPYAAHKRCNELDAAAYGSALGLPSFGLRFFNIYGPGQDPASPYSGVISIFCDRMRRGEALTVFGDGRQSRDFVAVADAVRALELAMDQASADAPVANVCRGKGTTLLELAQTIGALLGAEPQISFAPARAGDILHSRGDPALLETLTGFYPRTDLKEGLQALLSGEFLL